MNARGALLLVLGLGSSCASSPTTVLLEIQAEPGLTAPEELRLTVHDGAGSGPAVSERRLPEAGGPALPSSVVLYPRSGATLLRILVRAQRASGLLGEGAALVAPVSGQQIRTTLVIRSGALPDRDGDGVPDAIDSCPGKANPDQLQVCGAADGAPDLPLDAGLDGPAILDGRPDAAQADVSGHDAPTVDAIPKAEAKPKADTKPAPDTKPKADTKPAPDTKPKADTRPPDTSPPPPWLYRRAITISSAAGNMTLANYQVVVLLPTGFDYGKTKVGGADLRFSTSSSPFVPMNLSHYIESWTGGSSTGSSKIWVRVPSIPGQGTTTIYLFYGNPSASSTSSLSATFPGRFLSSGNLSLTGNQSYDWFELQAAHTLSLTAGQPLAISARKIVILGTVNGIGAGYPGGAMGVNPGGGPGGGQSLANVGSGGGGHGGAGGAGGYDPTDTMAAGGVANGSATDGVIGMGSGGGGSNVVGGKGGGALSLASRDVTVSGNIQLSGTGGLTSNQCSGGGAGGGLLVRGYEVSLASIDLSGGAGGVMGGAGNDGGGGGGGGRLKVFYQGSYNPPSSLKLVGGAGGAGGDAAPGQNGAAGSSHTASATVEVTSLSLGPEVAL